MSTTFKKSVLQRLPEDALRDLYIRVFGELPGMTFNCDEYKYNKALIKALETNEKVSNDEDFDMPVPEGADE